MVHPAFIYVLLLLAVFAVRLGCAQNLVMQSAPLPVIEGKINGMDVVAQGDSVAFFAGKLPSEYSDESCAEDLHCTLHKNHTRAVMISPDGVFLQLSPDHLEKDEDEEDESSSLVLPSQTLNTLDSSSSFSFKELFISTEEIEPTPTLATLYTGNPVVDQTPGLAWVNSETIRLLATTVETVNLLSTSTSSTNDEFTLIDPSPTESVKVLTTIAGELGELRRRLMSSAAVPVPTPVQTDNDDPDLESDEVWLDTELDVLKIRPSPTSLHGSSSEARSFVFTVRQAGTTTNSGAENTFSGSKSVSSVSATTEVLQSSNLPADRHSKQASGSPSTARERDYPALRKTGINEPVSYPLPSSSVAPVHSSTSSSKAEMKPCHPAFREKLLQHEPVMATSNQPTKRSSQYQAATYPSRKKSRWDVSPEEMKQRQSHESSSLTAKCPALDTDNLQSQKTNAGCQAKATGATCSDVSTKPPEEDKIPAWLKPYADIPMPDPATRQHDFEAWTVYQQLYAKKSKMDSSPNKRTSVGETHTFVSSTGTSRPFRVIDEYPVTPGITKALVLDTGYKPLTLDHPKVQEHKRYLQENCPTMTEEELATALSGYIFRHSKQAPFIIEVPDRP